MNSVKTIRKNYASPRQTASFSGLTKQIKKYGSSSKRIIQSALNSTSDYTLHRERKKPRIRNPFFILKKRQQVQMDLVDITSLAEHNDGIRFLFCSIDMFSRLAFVYPMKDKTAASAKQAIISMLSYYGSKPKEILSDRGTEFKNNIVEGFLKERKINHRFTNSDIKCAGVERFNKTLQGKIYKYLTSNNTRRYIDVLPDLAFSYNETPHSTIDISPHDTEKERFGEGATSFLACAFPSCNSGRQGVCT